MVLIPIPTGMRYTATMKGSVVKVVACEGCGTEYVYRLTCTATGTGRSALFLDNEGAKARASQQAEISLHQLLEGGCALVPCPSCGHVQQHMFPKARKQYRRWMLRLGVGLLLGLFPLAAVLGLTNAVTHELVPWPVFNTGLVLVGAAAIGLMIYRLVAASRYDPNKDDHEGWKTMGQKCAVLREDLEKRIRSNEAPGS